MAANKSAGYEALSRNYLDLKEDHGLIWSGQNTATARFGRLEVPLSWYLRSEDSNNLRLVALRFNKDPMPHAIERGMLSLLHLAKPEAAGVGVLNVQYGTLVLATRQDPKTSTYLETRAAKLLSIVEALGLGG